MLKYHLRGIFNLMRVLKLNTERKGLTLRQLATSSEDKAYFEAQNEYLKHITQFNNTVYKTLDEVRNARQNP